MGQQTAQGKKVCHSSLISLGLFETLALFKQKEYVRANKKNIQ